MHSGNERDPRKSCSTGLRRISISSGANSVSSGGIWNESLECHRHLRKYSRFMCSRTDTVWEPISRTVRRSDRSFFTKPISEKDTHHLHQLGKKKLSGTFTWKALHADLLIADGEGLEMNVASKVRFKRAKSRDVEVDICRGNFKNPRAHGSTDTSYLVLVLFAFDHVSKKVRMREETPTLRDTFIFPSMRDQTLSQ